MAGEVRALPLSKERREALVRRHERERELAIDIVDPPALEEVEYPKTLPPHDRDAEAAVLSACILDGNERTDGAASALSRVIDLLKPDRFYDVAHARIWQALEHLFASKTPIDIVSIASWLRERELLEKVGGLPYLVKLRTEVAVYGVENHARTVLDCWEKRALIAKLQQAAAELYGPIGNWDVHKAELRPELGRLTAPRLRTAGRPIGAVVDEVRSRVDAISAGEIVGVPWGFRALDPLGLLGRQRQTIIAGRPGMGKTSLGFQVCANVASTELDSYEVGEAVYVSTWEMPAELFLRRAACAYAYVDFNKLEAGRADAAELERLAHALAWLKQLPIILDDHKCTTRELAARVHQQQALFKAGKARRSDGKLYPRCRLGLVMLDYVQLGIDGAGPRTDKRVVVGKTSKGLVEHVAKGCDVATLVLAMLSRVKAEPNGNVREPMLDDLKESGEIEEDADTVVLIHRDDYYRKGKKCPPELRGVAKIIQAKGRYGMTDEILRLGFSRGRFSDQLPAAARGEPHYDEDT